MIRGFRDFILRGNVVDLAVAVVIGAAFGAVVTAFVADIITPLIAAIFGKPDFSALTFTINGSKFLYGSFINSVVSFLLIAAAVYFVVVVPMNKMNELRARGQAPEDPSTKQCPECLSEIPAGAHKCAFCTSEQPAQA
jgi:large conductance mechanosensitive channel